MSVKRRKLSEKFKAKVAIEAVRGLKSIQQIASENQVHPNQVSKWKSQLIGGAENLFSGSAGVSAKSDEELTAPLYEEIGRLKMDIKWLEKKF